MNAGTKLPLATAPTSETLGGKFGNDFRQSLNAAVPQSAGTRAPQLGGSAVANPLHDAQTAISQRPRDIAGDLDARRLARVNRFAHGAFRGVR